MNHSNIILGVIVCLATVSLAAEPAAGPSPFDPSANVLALVRAAEQRQDDLRKASELLNSERGAHLKEMSELRAFHANENRVSDSNQSAAIRIVDREDVAKTAASAQNAIQALAKQTTDLAVAVQKTLSDTATAVEQRQTAYAEAMNKRVSSLELTTSEGKGKQQLGDPQIVELVGEVKAMREVQASNAGKSEGISATMAMTIAGVLAFGTLAGSFLTYMKSRSNGKMIRENGRQRV